MACLWKWNTVKLAWYIGLLAAPTAPNVITVLSALIITVLGLGSVLERSVMSISSFSKRKHYRIFFIRQPECSSNENSLGLFAFLLFCREITGTSSVLFHQRQSCASMYVQCVDCTSSFSWVGVIIHCGRPSKNLQPHWQSWHIVSFASGLLAVSLASILISSRQTRLALQVNGSA
jgi:hypothetical protein